MLKIQPQRYINLFSAETAHAVIVYAICIEVIAPGEYVVSEPRIVKVTPKRQLALPGAISSPFALSGVVLKQARAERVISPFQPQFAFNSAALKWYFSNAPNIIFA